MCLVSPRDEEMPAVIGVATADEIGAETVATLAETDEIGAVIEETAVETGSEITIGEQEMVGLLELMMLDVVPTSIAMCLAVLGGGIGAEAESDGGREVVTLIARGTDCLMPS